MIYRVVTKQHDDNGNAVVDNRRKTQITTYKYSSYGKRWMVTDKALKKEQNRYDIGS
jgi:hypothetical protein